MALTWGVTQSFLASHRKIELQKALICDRMYMRYKSKRRPLPKMIHSNSVVYKIDNEQRRTKESMREERIQKIEEVS